MAEKQYKDKEITPLPSGEGQGGGSVEYTDDNIRHLSDMDHVRTRPGMYIGRLGDGSHAEDGIYVLLKEIILNSSMELSMISFNST